MAECPLTLALQQIGQVMLALPHAMSLMGLRAACVIIPCYTLISMWTMHLLTALYVEYKARKVRCNNSMMPPSAARQCLLENMLRVNHGKYTRLLDNALVPYIVGWAIC